MLCHFEVDTWKRGHKPIRASKVPSNLPKILRRGDFEKSRHQSTSMHAAYMHLCFLELPNVATGR